MKKIVSLDPSSKKNCGWAVYDYETFTAGTFVLETVEEPHEMLYPLGQLVEALLVEHKPEFVLCEKTSSFFGSFITGQISMCIGVIAYICGKFSIPIVWCSPTHVKKNVTGKGKAKKKEIKVCVIKELQKSGQTNIKFDSEHSYDAIAQIFSFFKDKEEIK